MELVSLTGIMVLVQWKIRNAHAFNRPMPSVGKGVHELRLKDRSGQYRVFYYTKLKNDILVISFGFKKKTKATPKKEIDLAKRRCR